MPQPFNWKDPNTRITETIQMIRDAGMLGTYTSVVGFLTTWSNNHLNAARKQAVSLAMHQGSHWEKGRSDVNQAARKLLRDKRRAMLLMRVVILNETIQTATAGVAGITDLNIPFRFGQLVGDCATSLMPVLSLNTASGRMQRSGLLNPNNRTSPFFPDQSLLLAHFRDYVMPTIQNPMTQAVYAAALLTVGNTVWGPGQSDPAGKIRFNNFDGTEDGQRLIINCWEGLLFWACKGNAFTVAACRGLYDDYDLNNKSANIRNLFGTQAEFDPLTAAPGDVLTWINGPHMNHVAMYAGLGPAPGLTTYLIHNLALDAVADGVGGGLGTTHFRTTAHMNPNYLQLYGAAICYQNQPFWVATGNTAEYQYRQRLMA